MYQGLACRSPSSSRPNPATRSPSVVTSRSPGLSVQASGHSRLGSQYRRHSPGRSSAQPWSGGAVGVGELEAGEALGVLQLEAQGLGIVALEHGDEQRQRQERVRAELEQPGIVVRGQGLPLVVVELQPGAALVTVHVQDRVGPLGFPPLNGAARVFPVPLDELGVAVDGVQELVQQVLAHAPAPFGYQVKYASMVWKRSRVSA